MFPSNLAISPQKNEDIRATASVGTNANFSPPRFVPPPPAGTKISPTILPLPGQATPTSPPLPLFVIHYSILLFLPTQISIRRAANSFLRVDKRSLTDVNFIVRRSNRFIQKFIPEHPRPSSNHLSPVTPLFLRWSPVTVNEQIYYPCCSRCYRSRTYRSSPLVSFPVALSFRSNASIDCSSKGKQVFDSSFNLHPLRNSLFLSFFFV